MLNHIHKFAMLAAFLLGFFVTSSVYALGVHGGLVYFQSKGDIARTLAFNAIQTSGSGDAKGHNVLHNQIANTDFFGTVLCIAEKRPGLYVIYGKYNSPSTDNGASFYSIIVLERDKGEPDAATQFSESDLGSCSDIQAFVDTFTEAELMDYATLYEQLYGPAVGNIKITP